MSWSSVSPSDCTGVANASSVGASGTTVAWIRPVPSSSVASSWRSAGMSSGSHGSMLRTKLRTDRTSRRAARAS